jgi:hypothetical protein
MALKRILVGAALLSLAASSVWWWTRVVADYETTELSDGWERVGAPDLGISARCPPNWKFSKSQDAMDFRYDSEPRVDIRCYTGNDAKEYLENCTRSRGYRRILINGKPAVCLFVRRYHFGWGDAGYDCRFITLETSNCVYQIVCRVRYEENPPSREREAELDALLGSIETKPIDEHLTYVFKEPRGQYSFSYPRNWSVRGLTSSSVSVGSNWPGVYIVISVSQSDEKGNAKLEPSVEDMAKDFSVFRWQSGLHYDYVIDRPNGVFRFAVTMGESSVAPRMDETLQVLRSFHSPSSGIVESAKPE